MTDPAVRAWTADDCGTVRRIALETWKAAYGSFIPEADQRAYLERSYAEQVLREKIRTPTIRGYIAAWDGVDVAYMIVSLSAEEHRCSVSSVYVLPAYQGKGIGRVLLAEARRCARANGCDRIWLGVMVENTAARAWYERNGFVFTERAPFTMGGTTVEHVIGYQMIDGKN
jgi:ribosomal protein S18 acetylase RimI-like enzyme